MATTRKTAPKSDPKVTDANPPAENETPEDNGAENEEVELSTLDQEMARLPETDDPMVSAMLPFAAQEVAKIRDDRDIVLANSLTPEGINAFAHNSDHADIVKLREAHEEANAEVTRLMNELNDANATLQNAQEVWEDKAKEVMSENLDTPAKLAAEMRIKQTRSKLTGILTPIKNVMEDEGNEPIKEYVTYVNSAAYAGQPVVIRSTNGDRGPSKSDQSEKVRHWCRKNGIMVNDKGRLPKDIVLAYNQANPNDRVTLYD